MNLLRRRQEEYTPVFDVNSIETVEDDIREMLPHARLVPNEYAPEPKEPEMTQTDIGKITAEAIATAHEAAAAALVELGKEADDRMKLIEKLKLDEELAAKDCLDTAQIYREAGKRASEEIKRTSEWIASVRDVCADLRKKIEGPA